MRANMDSSHRKDVGCDMCNWFFGIYSQVYGRRLRFFSNDRTQEGYKGTFWLMDFVRYFYRICQTLNKKTIFWHPLFFPF